MPRPNTYEDFLKRIDKKSNGCWEYTGGKNQCGYGIFGINRKHILAHRYHMEYLGHNICGMEVIHSCDNPPCVNPEHLSVATHYENMMDRQRKGRTINPNAGKNKRAIRTPYGDFNSIAAAEKAGRSKTYIYKNLKIPNSGYEYI
jgi:hypothetical protein